MRIENITINNFRLYKSQNTINFPNNDDKNISIITGENGFGKTSFLYSLLWCMYGRLMVDIDETFRKEIFNSGGYNSFLRNNLNETVRQHLFSNISESTHTQIKKIGYTSDLEYLKEFSQYSVSLEFSDLRIPSIPCQFLKIIRTYDVIKEYESVEILIDGNINELTTEIGNEIFINDFILNKDIARFFFFDSEKIVTLAESNTLEEKRKLSSAYSEVLGVKKYEDLKKTLENLRLRFRRKSDDTDNRNKLNNLIEKQKSLNENIAELEAKTKLYDEQLIFLRKEDESFQIQLLREGNETTLEQLNRQEAVLEVTRKKDIEYKQKLKQYLEYAPFAISGKLLQQTKEQLEQDFNILNSETDIKNQNFLLENISVEIQKVINDIKIPNNEKQQIIDSLNRVINKYQTKKTDKLPLLNVVKEDFDEFLSVYTNITTTYRVEFEHLADDYRKNKQIMERATRTIANMHVKENDSAIKAIRIKKNECEQKIVESEQTIRLLHEERGAVNKELAVVNRQISELSKKVSVDDSDLKKDKVAEELISDLNTFLVKLKQEKKFSLERRIKMTLNLLMHKKDFIGKVDILIDNDMIDINLYSVDNTLIKKESLSKGEQQLYATSLLKALVEESGIQFPVFIDSPLQKFDKKHANKIITEFYPNISKQVILFPLLHKELADNEFLIMKPYVNSVFLLKNNNSYSSIQQVEINNLMNN